MAVDFKGKGRFEVKTSSNDKDYFVLNATNGQIIGKNQMYQSSSSCVAVAQEQNLSSAMQKLPRLSMSLNRSALMRPRGKLAHTAIDMGKDWKTIYPD